MTENSGKDGYGAHDYDNDTDTDCNTCGYIRTITPSHTHSWATAWSKNETHHWHECTGEGICNVTENSDKDGYAKHTASEWITDTAATATTDGSKHKECTFCKYVLETEIIPATGYLVTFNGNGGTPSDTSARTDKDGKLTSLPTPTRSGYRFNGWYTIDGKKITKDTVFTDDTTVYAHWTKKTTSGSSGSGSNSGTTIIQSAKTADIGVMIYGMTALLSLTGGAWVINKKRKGK